jgi:hypothetical protein
MTIVVAAVHESRVAKVKPSGRPLSNSSDDAQRAATVVTRSAGEMRTPNRSHQMITL